MERIDNLDRQILEIISQNARIPFKDVAAECGVSRAAIHQRVQRLIDLGVIVGSGYHVNPKSLGYRTCTCLLYTSTSGVPSGGCHPPSLGQSGNALIERYPKDIVIRQACSMDNA